MELATILNVPLLEGRTRAQTLGSDTPMPPGRGLPIEVAHLVAVLARIESRRLARLRGREQEGKD